MYVITMLMLKLRRKKTLALILLIITSLSFLTSIDSSALVPPIVDVPIMYTADSRDIRQMTTRSVLDSEGRPHYFVQISYYNGSFTILHIFNAEIQVIAEEYNAAYTFELRAVGDGVYLYYTYYGQFGGVVYKLYTWTEESSDTSIVFSSSGYEEYTSYFLVEDEKIYLFYIEERYGETSIIHQKIFYPNGSESYDYYEIPFEPYYLRSLAILNDELFGLFHSIRYDVGTYETIITIVGFTENGYYNSTVFSYEVDWYEPKLVVGLDKNFHLSLMSYGFFYTAKFSINESIDVNSFTSVTLQRNIYTDRYNIFSYENTTYYVFDDFSDILYMEYYPGSDYGLRARITVIIDTEDDLYSESIQLSKGVNNYAYYSASAEILENGSYFICYTSTDNTKEIDNYHFLGKTIVAINAFTDLDIPYPEEPILYHLKSYSAFAYFWVKYWYTIAIPIIVLGIIYAIFHKRINRGFRKLKKFLLRPIVKDASNAKLIFTNLWLFIVNASSLIFTLWRTNKKRLLINLLGFTILATIIIASTSLYDSKRNSMVLDYITNYDVYGNGQSSVYLRILSTGVAIENLTIDIMDSIIGEVINTIQRNSVLFSRTLAGYHYSVGSNAPINFGVVEIYHHGYTDNYSVILENLLLEGKLPTNSGEIMISSAAASYYDINIDDSIPISPSFNITIAGIYNVPGYSVLRALCDENNLPLDPIGYLTSYYSALAPIEHYFGLHRNISDPSLSLAGTVQLMYDFSDISPNEISALNLELEALDNGGPYGFSLLPTSTWEFNNEFRFAFYGIETILMSTQILVLFILVPIIYLAWFLIFEVNELFGLSFEQEIRILRSKGVSTGNISFIYLSMKTIEAIISSILGFLIMLALVPPLLKVNKFIEFNESTAKISFTSVPISVCITLVLLLIISFPRIIRMSKSEKKIQKTPRKLVRLLKTLRLNYLFIIILGGIVGGLGFWLFSVFSYGFGIPGLGALALVFIYLMGIGVMIALLGVGLLLKDLHKILMIVLSKISWRTKKTKFSLSLVDIRSDINLFNNSFLTYVIIIGIIMPFIISPIAIQNKTTNEALFYGGSDIYIKDWQNQDPNLLDKLILYNEIDSLSNISIFQNVHGDVPLHTLVYNDLDNYLDSAFKPPKHMVENWEEKVKETNADSVMMVSRPFYMLITHEENSYTFGNYTFTISSTFDLFPILHDGTIDFFSGEYHFVTNLNNYQKLNESLLSFEGYTVNRILIKLKPLVNQAKFAEKLETELNINVESTKEEADQLLIISFPFYSLMVAEFVFGILICLTAIVFTSLSNPIKILQRRITKHDVLRKIGAPSTSIILLTGLELLISAILPGLVLGGLMGYGLVRLTGFLMLSFSYSVLPYAIPYPYPAMLLIFLGIPILFYAIFFIAMKINFIKFRPRNLE